MFCLQPPDFIWVRREARRFVAEFPSYFAELEDLEQVGYVVLLLMARRFNGNNSHFSSLAYMRIQGAFRNHIAWLTERKHSATRPSRAFIADFPDMSERLYGPVC